MSSIQTCHTFDTKINADCVAWCPIKGSEHILICTTYQLVTNKSKTGSILLFNTDCNKLLLSQAVVGLPGIFDLKWKPDIVSNGKIVLATADSEGLVVIYSLDDDKTGLLKITSYKLFPDENEIISALYVDWSIHDEVLVVTSANGSVSLLKYDCESLICIQQWKAHNFEAWVACFNVNIPNIIYTGGDDSIMKCYDYRITPASQVWRSTEHTAGVTSFMTSTDRPNQLASGSYDERLLLWDSRSIKLKNPLSEMSLGGGVWRLKAHDGNVPLKVVSACMFAGFKILHWNDCNFVLTESFRQDEECLAYGADWCVKNNLFAACSFYDHKLTICEHITTV